jgi:hypothetical protein
MIKQTWEISQEERNRIISLHESATKNFYILSEQISTVKKTRDVDIILSTRDPKIIKYLDTQDLRYFQYATDFGKKEFTQAVNQMKSKMDETSLGVFEKLANENPKFYLYVISRYMGPKLRDSKGNRGEGVFGGSNLKNKKIIVDDRVTIQEEITPPEEGNVSEPVMEQGYTMITPPSVQQPMQFEFNEAVMKPEFIQYINENIFGGIDQAIKEMSDELVKEGRKPADVWVNNLKITSSSSTIPNGVSEKTFPGKVPTFKELSDARAKVVYDYLVEGLKQRNSVINPNGVEINTEGTNAGKEITVKSGNQTIKLDGTGTSGPEYNGQNKEELRKYQRVDLIFNFAVKGTTPPRSEPFETEPIPPQFIPDSQTDFMVRFNAIGRKKLKIKLRIPQITLPNISLKGLFGKGTSTPCYYY